MRCCLTVLKYLSRILTSFLFSPYQLSFRLYKTDQTYSVLKPDLLGLKEPSRINTLTHNPTHNSRKELLEEGGTSIHNPFPSEKMAAFWLACVIGAKRKESGEISRRETRAQNGKRNGCRHGCLLPRPLLLSHVLSSHLPRRLIIIIMIIKTSDT